MQSDSVSSSQCIADSTESASASAPAPTTGAPRAREASAQPERPMSEAPRATQNKRYNMRQRRAAVQRDDDEEQLEPQPDHPQPEPESEVIAVPMERDPEFPPPDEENYQEDASSGDSKGGDPTEEDREELLQELEQLSLEEAEHQDKDGAPEASSKDTRIFSEPLPRKYELGPNMDKLWKERLDEEPLSSVARRNLIKGFQMNSRRLPPKIGMHKDAVTNQFIKRMVFDTIPSFEQGNIDAMWMVAFLTNQLEIGIQDEDMQHGLKRIFKLLQDNSRVMAKYRREQVLRDLKLQEFVEKKGKAEQEVMLTAEDVQAAKQRKATTVGGWRKVQPKAPFSRPNNDRGYSSGRGTQAYSSFTSNRKPYGFNNNNRNNGGWRFGSNERRYPAQGQAAREANPSENNQRPRGAPSTRGQRS